MVVKASLSGFFRCLFVYLFFLLILNVDRRKMTTLDSCDLEFSIAAARETGLLAGLFFLNSLVQSELMNLVGKLG
jgi:hypothetical protein